MRGDLNAQVAELFKRAADPTLTPGDAIEIVSELSAAIDSGLLETSEHATASGVQDGLLGRTLSRLDVRYRKVFAGKHPPYEATGIDVDDRYAAHLLAQGRFDQFRALRRAKRAPWHGRYRHRLVGARQADAALKGRLRAVTAVRR